METGFTITAAMSLAARIEFGRLALTIGTLPLTWEVLPEQFVRR
jgi:hypothetical protein